MEQFLKQPPEVRFQEVRYLLEAFGFEEKGLRVAIIVFETPKLEDHCTQNWGKKS
ncbi:hypothetical protein [Nostoc sp. NOS(2021)]|uniref:hypothetical protein n=1 Tax=Nostoc sp. NOS(2021) TaxID=2815407 RepID=UPI0025D26F29|nr:hypothetical protein [Nostoc sp. NOS(2021)]